MTFPVASISTPFDILLPFSRLTPKGCWTFIPSIVCILTHPLMYLKTIRTSPPILLFRYVFLEVSAKVSSPVQDEFLDRDQTSHRASAISLNCSCCFFDICKPSDSNTILEGFVFNLSPVSIIHPVHLSITVFARGVSR